MGIPHLNWIAVLVSGIVIFMLGGLWYSPVLFAKPWVALMGKSEEEMKASASGPLPYVFVFFCGVVTAFVMACVMNHYEPFTALHGAKIGAICWLGFAAPSSFATATFSATPRKLWMINSGYNLVSFIIAGVILALWR